MIVYDKVLQVFTGCGPRFLALSGSRGLAGRCIAATLAPGAGAVVSMMVIAPVIVLTFVLFGLRRPCVRLNTWAKKQPESLHNSMWIGVSVPGSLLSSGVGVQQALRRSSPVGGTFCNLIELPVAPTGVEGLTKAIEVRRAHLSDPADVEANRFLRGIHDFFANNHPVLPGAQGSQDSQDSVHRSVVEATGARAALVRRRAGLFGVMAVPGPVLAIIMPFALARGAHLPRVQVRGSAGVGAGLV